MEKTAADRLKKMEDPWLPPRINELTGQELISEEENNSSNNENKEINVLPLLILKDLATAGEEKAWKRKTFSSFIYRSVLNIPPNYHAALLLLCSSNLVYQVKNSSTNPFDLQFRDSTKASQPLLCLGEAFIMFFPEMAHITKFILSYFLTVMLIWPLHPGVQIFFMLLLISAPLHYFPELGRMASGIDVDCSFIKMPLIWVTILGALGLSLICGLVTWFIIYCNWIFIHKGRPDPEVQDLEVSLDGFSDILVLDV